MTNVDLNATQPNPSVLPPKIRILDNSSSGKIKVSLSIVENKSSFKKGDSLQYLVSSNIDCFISLFSFQSDGSWVMLFPNPYESDILLKKDKTREFPGSIVDGYDFIVDAPYGKDTICVIACSIEQELTLKLKEVTDNDPQYVSLHRGVFPISQNYQKNSSESPLWDIDWVTIETSEFGETKSVLILPRRPALIMTIMGLLLVSGAAVVWKKNLQ